LRALGELGELGVLRIFFESSESSQSTQSSPKIKLQTYPKKTQLSCNLPFFLNVVITKA
jgi:hypothetical protein